jgi:hypothetical protein
MAPGLDLSQTLASYMLSDVFTVRRRTSIVGTNGRGTTSDQLFKGVRGVVTTEGDSSNDRNDKFSTSQKSLSVITRFLLRDQVRHALPDIIIWHGDEYLVDSLEDATNYGAGFVEAGCSSIDLQNASPGKVTATPAPPGS